MQIALLEMQNSWKPKCMYVTNGYFRYFRNVFIRVKCKGREICKLNAARSNTASCYSMPKIENSMLTISVG